MFTNKQKTLSLGLVIVSSLLLGGCTPQDSNTSNSSVPSVVEALPERPAEVNGYVRSIEGNEIVIANEIREKILTEEDKAAQQEERKSLTPEARQALKAQEAETLATEKLTLTIPVGVPLLKASGLADGSSVPAELSDIKSDAYLSIWLLDGVVEAVKLKGVN